MVADANGTLLALAPVGTGWAILELVRDVVMLRLSATTAGLTRSQSHRPGWSVWVPTDTATVVESSPPPRRVGNAWTPSAVGC
jgi:hypothetical protein